MSFLNHQATADYDRQHRVEKRKFEEFMAAHGDCVGAPWLAICEKKEQSDASQRGAKRRGAESSSTITAEAGSGSGSGKVPDEVVEGKSLFLFVRIMTGKSLAVVVNRNDTVLALHEKIERATCMPVKEQRLIYGGRQLDIGKSLEDYGVEKESTLQLVGRLPSGRNPEIWQMVDDMVLAAIRLCRGDAAINLEDIRVLMSKFLTRVRADDAALGMSHLKIFTSLSAIDALSMVYLSANERSKQVANDSIRQFLISTHEFPESLHTYAATMVMGFCKHLAKMDPKDALYFACRSTLGTLVGGTAVVQELVDSSGGSLSLPEIFPFLFEAGCSVNEDFVDGVEVVTEWALLSHVRDFAAFMKPALAYIRELVHEEGPIGLPVQIGEFQRHSFWKEISFLHLMYVELCGIMSTCLSRVDVSLKDAGEFKFMAVGFQYLLILKELNALSKIYSGEADNFSKMFRQNIIPLRALITKCVKRNEDNNWLLEYKDVLDFDCRRHLAMMMFPEVKEDYDEIHEMLIDRSQLLAESFEYISNAEPETLRAGLFMEFKNEEATGPGVVREWFFLVCKEMFNPQNALFIANPNDRTRFFINPASEVDPKHLDYFRVCGRVIALALMHKVQVGIVLDRVLFMQLAGIIVQLEDIKDTDPILYRSCKQILDMDADLIDSDALGLTFIREYEELGARKRTELITGGESIKLNSENRAIYVEALIRSHFLTATYQQMDHFAQGFGDILCDPENQTLFFRSLELEDLDRMLRGNRSDLSIADWKLHTEYNGYRDSDPQIGWFWKILEEMAEGQRRVLLFFWTSVRYLPVEGFSGLSSPLYILKSEGTKEHLPTSHTCFQQLCIPEYPTFEMMKDRFNIVTQDHMGSSFGSS
uniref:HECT-type E3 ubiquitin transferase n=1 Tax=Kalanchoe fedtschenkoi TaxID=63787 RepID=A0A7N0UCW8_KALFE